MPASPPRRALVVLGMHRGGTSAVAGMLHRLGVDFGPRLMPANADNPAGYYEHNDVVNLHDRFLGRLGAAWDDPFPPEFDPTTWPDLAPAPGCPTYRAELLAILGRDFAGGDGRSPAPLWGLKDPRLCLLLPWWEPSWKTLETEPRFIIVLRSPEAVGASLGRRDGFSPIKSQLLWLHHLLRAERDTRGRSRCFVDYDAFLGDWRGTLDRVGASLGIAWPRDPSSLSAGEASFIDPGLRHHDSPRSKAPGVQGVALPWMETIHPLLPPAGPNEAATLDTLYQELTRSRLVFANLGEHRDADLGHQLRAQRRLTSWYEEEWQKALDQVKEISRRLEQRDKKIQSLQARPGKSR